MGTRARRVAERRAHGRRASGQGLAEYALILTLIAVLVVVGLAMLAAYFGASVSLATPPPSAPHGASFAPGASFLPGTPTP
jgi:uncharacterized protein (DUF58 family)